MDLADFDALPKTVIGKGELLAAKGATVMRVPINESMAISMAKEENSFEWAVLLTPKSRGLPSPPQR